MIHEDKDWFFFFPLCLAFKLLLDERQKKKEAKIMLFHEVTGVPLICCTHPESITVTRRLGVCWSDLRDVGPLIGQSRSIIFAQGFQLYMCFYFQTFERKRSWSLEGDIFGSNQNMGIPKLDRRVVSPPPPKREHHALRGWYAPGGSLAVSRPPWRGESHVRWCGIL